MSTPRYIHFRGVWKHPSLFTLQESWAVLQHLRVISTKWSVISYWIRRIISFNDVVQPRCNYSITVYSCRLVSNFLKVLPTSTSNKYKHFVDCLVALTLQGYCKVSYSGYSPTHLRNYNLCVIERKDGLWNRQKLHFIC